MSDHTRDNPPPIVQKAAHDVVINSDSIWCSIGDGEPFCNTICWAGNDDDGKGVWFGLDTHNSAHCKLGETIGVVEGDPKTAPSKYVMRAEDFIHNRKKGPNA